MNVISYSGVSYFLSCAAGSSNVPRLDQLYCFTSNCILMLTNGQTDKHMIV